MTPIEAEQPSRGWKGLAVLFGIVFLVWFASGFVVKCFEDPGGIGDMFGAVNALFSGLAFAGVIYAIILQRDELGLQRRELEMTRAELKGQKEAMLQQRETMDLQRFENTFFNLLQFHSVTTRSIEDEFLSKRIDPRHRTNERELIRGRDYFLRATRVISEVVSGFRNKLKARATEPADENDPKIGDRIGQYFSSRESVVGHYFRSLQGILAFIERSSVVDKLEYAAIVRDQLSSGELSVIYLYCLTKEGHHLKRLAAVFDLMGHFKNPDLEKLVAQN